MSNATAATLTVDGDTIDFGPDYQGVTIWLGDGLPVHLNDAQTPADVLDLIETPQQRAVTLARLECIVAALRSA